VAALINAITTANGNGEADIINLAADGTYTLTAVDNNTDGPNGLPSITSEITINGNGATIQRSSAGGTPAFRIFHVAAGGNMTLNDLTVTNGKTPDGGTCTGYDCDGGDGGGIYTNNYYGGAVTIVNSTLSGNSTGNGDTDGRGGGLVSSTSSSVLTNVTISGNTAKGHGGALWHNTNGSGGPKRVF